MPSAVSTFKACLGANFAKDSTEEANLQLYLGGQRVRVQGRGIVCGACESMMQISISTWLLGLKCWV